MGYFGLFNSEGGVDGVPGSHTNSNLVTPSEKRGTVVECFNKKQIGDVTGIKNYIIDT